MEIHSRHLVNGKIKSCGCLNAETSPRNGKVGAWKISGSLSHLYNPELTDEHRQTTRNVVLLREWRKAVYERDSYTCQICGLVGGKLNAHHLDCWSNFPDKRFLVENGITLCRDHHAAFHMFCGGQRLGCTLDDFLKWRYNETHHGS